MKLKIYIDVDEKNRINGWGDTFFENSIEIEVEENHPVLMAFGRYLYVDGELVEDKSRILEEMKAEKDFELNQACRDAIIKGFTYEINGVDYHFSFDTEAQLNFQGAERMLKEGLVEEILWTVRKGEEYIRIVIDRNIMNELALAILNHKNNNISKYRDFLMPLVNGAETVEEINSITW